MMSSNLLSQIDNLISEWNNLYEDICFPGYKGKACPVPFFGNIESKQPVVFTMGSNPSDREFLYHGSLITPFRFLDTSKPYPANDLFKACCNYFDNNPYKGWFGDKNGAKNEGFLNVINPDASYYGNKTCQAVHVDLIPFPTLAKYSCFKVCHHNHIARMQALGDSLLDILINDYKPELIICIGRDSCKQWLGNPVGNGMIAGKKFDYYKGKIKGVDAFGTSVYYPNSPTSQIDWKKDIVPLM